MAARDYRINLSIMKAVPEISKLFQNCCAQRVRWRDTDIRVNTVLFVYAVVREELKRASTFGTRSFS